MASAFRDSSRQGLRQGLHREHVALGGGWVEWPHSDSVPPMAVALMLLRSTRYALHARQVPGEFVMLALCHLQSFTRQGAVRSLGRLESGDWCPPPAAWIQCLQGWLREMASLGSRAWLTVHVVRATSLVTRLADEGPANVPLVPSHPLTGPLREQGPLPFSGPHRTLATSGRPRGTWR